jgi:hypothetical protein
MARSILTSLTISTGDNTITSHSSTIKPLIIKGATSQTANLTEWQNPAGSGALAWVASDGSITTSNLNAISPNASYEVITSRGASGQIGDLFVLKNSTPTTLAGANAVGQLYTGSTTPINYQVGGTPTATSGTGTTATITLTSASNLAIGDLIRVTGFTPSGYNTTGYAVVSAVSNTAPFTVSYASSGTGTMTVAGQVQTVPQASFTARSTATVPLIVKGNGYNMNLQTWLKSDNNPGIIINPYGSLVGSASANQFNSDNGANYIFRTVGVSDQRGNHYQVVNSSSAILAGFNGQGQLFTGRTLPDTGATTVAIGTQTPTGTTNITITTGAAHGIVVGQTVIIAGVTPVGYNGTWTAQAGTTGTTLVVNIGSNPGAITVAGTVVQSAQLSVTATSVNNTPIVVRGVASQVANLQEWRSSTGSMLARVEAAGNFIIAGIGVTSGDHRVGTSNYFSAALNVLARSTTEKGLVIRGQASQSANLFETQDSNGTSGIKFYIDAVGNANFSSASWVQNSTGKLTLGLTSASAVGLTVRGTGTGGTYTQTANLQEWLSWDGSTPTTLAFMSPAGVLSSKGLTLSGTTSPITLNGSVGTSGQVLTSAGAGATPTWTTVSGGSFTGGTLTSNLTLAAGTTSLSPLTFQSGTNLTTVTAGANEYDGTVFYQTSNTNPGRALATQNYYYASSSSWLPDFFNSGSVQGMLGGATKGITLAAGTTYEYELYATVQHQFISNTGVTGTYQMVSSTVSGSPTVAVVHQVDYGSNTTNFTTATTLTTVRTTGTVVFSAAISSGSRYNFLRAKGIIRVTGTGTAKVYPGISTSQVGASDNIWTVQEGLVFKLTPIGNGTATTVGTWA